MKSFIIYNLYIFRRNETLKAKIAHKLHAHQFGLVRDPTENDNQNGAKESE